MARDAIAQKEDIAPGRLVKSDILGDLARRKPRSRADIANWAIFRRRSLRYLADAFWKAIEEAWKTNPDALPERSFSEKSLPFPHLNKWETQNPAGLARWNTLRPAIFEFADELGIRQDVLLKPTLQKRLAWEGWESMADLGAKLNAWGARPWQIEQCGPVIYSASSQSR